MRKFECFGTANMSDTCAQCPNNKPCVDETMRRWEKTKTIKVKVFCHSCNGNGYVEDKAYPSAEVIKILCPECEGQKYVWEDQILVEKPEKVGEKSQK